MIHNDYAKLYNHARAFKKQNPNMDGDELFGEFDSLEIIQKINKNDRGAVFCKLIKIFDTTFETAILADMLSEQMFSDQSIEKYKKRYEQFKNNKP